MIDLLTLGEINRKNIKAAESLFTYYEEQLAQKLQRCNGARPHKGFMKNYMVQLRRNNFKLIKGEDNGTQE